MSKSEDVRCPNESKCAHPEKIKIVRGACESCGCPIHRSVKLRHMSNAGGRIRITMDYEGRPDV